MQYYDFSRLIDKYSTDFSMIVPTTGRYNASGDWEKGQTNEIKATGAIISSGNAKLYRSDGTLNTKDKMLFMLQPITYALEGAKVIYGGDTYSIENDTENAQFTGVYSYVLRYVSAFKPARPKYDVTDTGGDTVV